MKCLFSCGIFALLVGGCAPRPVAETSYTYPLTSPGAVFASLPPQVQNAARAETGSAEITNVMKLDLPNGLVYQISFQDPKEYPTLYIAQDGSVLDTNLTVAVGAPVEPASTLTGGGASGL